MLLEQCFISPLGLVVLCSASFSYSKCYQAIFRLMSPQWKAQRNVAPQGQGNYLTDCPWDMTVVRKMVVL